MKPPFINTKSIKLIELFGGIGSQAKALENLCVEFEHYRLVEFDKYAVASYNAIHCTDFEPSDITKIRGDDLGIVETDSFTYLITYSFPCQDLSLAGKRRGMTKGSGTRSGLLWEVERLLDETENLPQLLLMENVPQVHSKANMPDFEKWIEFLESKGYSNFYQDLNAKDYGVGQNRNRCFMISILGDYSFFFPKPVELEKKLKDYLEDSVDEKFYVNNEKADKLVDQFLQDTELVEREQGKSQTALQLEKTVAKLGNLNRYTGGNFNGNVYSKVFLAPTLDTMQGGYRQPMICEICKIDVVEEQPKMRIRRLTPKECYRLMGFDDESFERAEKVNSNTQLYKQAGNSIVVNVLMAIFENLFINAQSVWLDELLNEEL